MHLNIGWGDLTGQERPSKAQQEASDAASSKQSAGRVFAFEIGGTQKWPLRHIVLRPTFGRLFTSIAAACGHRDYPNWGQKPDWPKRVIPRRLALKPGKHRSHHKLIGREVFYLIDSRLWEEVARRERLLVILIANETGANLSQLVWKIIESASERPGPQPRLDGLVRRFGRREVTEAVGVFSGLPGADGLDLEFAWAPG